MNSKKTIHYIMLVVVKPVLPYHFLSLLFTLGVKLLAILNKDIWETIQNKSVFCH